MYISEYDYLNYMFMIEQKMTDNKIKYNEICNKQYKDEECKKWIEETKKNLREENKRLCQKWIELNKPEGGTKNRCIEFYNADKVKKIKMLVI